MKRKLVSKSLCQTTENPIITAKQAFEYRTAKFPCHKLNFENCRTASWINKNYTATAIWWGFYHTWNQKFLCVYPQWTWHNFLQANCWRFIIIWYLLFFETAWKSCLTTYARLCSSSVWLALVDWFRQLTKFLQKQKWNLWLHMDHRKHFTGLSFL